ncbi:MAG: hypothetical protein JW770_01065, partial [Actinobacteria bacterium]|nr:hypothetical protein [Actinomycetota bacterium]
MNARDKFNSVMGFETNCRNMKTEYGYWAGALGKWVKDGLPKIGDIPGNYLDGDLVRVSLPLREDTEFVDKSLISYFNLDPYPTKFPCDFSPMLKRRVIEEDEEQKIFVDEYGLTQKILKKGASVPMVIKYVIKNTDDFNEYKSLYSDNYHERLPGDWENLVKNLKNRSFAIRLGGYPFGFSGIGRTLMGDVNFM